MRLISLILLVLISFSWAIGDEVSVGIDRAALILPGNEDADFYGPRLAVHFSIPEAVEDAEIIFAEIYLPLENINFQYDGDGILEIQAQNISSIWSEENVADFHDVDSTTFYTYTVNLSNDDVHMDITEFVNSITSDEADNFGLMLMPIKHDQEAFQLPQNIVSLVRNFTQIKITYE